MKAKISKKVQAANKLFNSLSPAKRRVNPNWFYYNATLPENPSDRMKTIMKNIVDNNGICKLPRAPKDFVKGFKDLIFTDDKHNFAREYVNS